ncbi:MAG: hypothetical protein E4H03_05355 [Myxococcales bacterium]|jgi:hypothetical protein|nr:MAG: hypothetical protein E4H03_05355 [Myxococcales bacterium]
MLLLVVVIGVMIIAFSAFAVATPAFLRRSIEYWVEPKRLYMAVALRVVMGVLLVAVADDARSPILVRGLGYSLIAAGLIIPVLGTERIGAFARWWENQSDLVLRLWGVAACGLGALIIYSVT